MIRAISKETGVDVANVRLKLYQIIKKAVKVFEKIYTNSDALSASLTNLFENLKIATINTLNYFLLPHG